MKKAEPVMSVGFWGQILKKESGFSLVLVLVVMTILGLSAGIAGSTWSTITRRAREADLLWKGAQIRKAIGSYYRASHGQGAPNIFPSRLEYLLKDPRFLQTRRHLRRLYPDPMTGEDWVLIKDPGGRIKGVHSSLQKTPFKQGNFSVDNQDFEGRESYSEWEFVYVPKTKSTTTQKESGTSPSSPQIGHGESPQG